MTSNITNVRPALGDMVEITLDDGSTRTIVVQYISESDPCTFSGTTFKDGLPTSRSLWANLDHPKPYGVVYARPRSAGTQRYIAAARIVLSSADRCAMH